MIFSSPSALSSFAKQIGGRLKPPVVFELVGDVGAGKTTFTRALARGLGVKSQITSPSFSISKRYAFPGGELVHYDFYRLDDPGIMSSELSEALLDTTNIIVIEWGDSVKDILPDDRIKINFKIIGEEKRELSFMNFPSSLKPLLEELAK